MDLTKYKLKSYTKQAVPSQATLDRLALKKKEDDAYALSNPRQYFSENELVEMLIKECLTPPYWSRLVVFIQYKLVCGAIVILKLKDKFFNLFKTKEN